MDLGTIPDAIRFCSSLMAFRIEEATIRDMQLAFDRGELTSAKLVQYYLDNIKKQNGRIHAVIEVNPDALTLAQEADRKRCLPGGCSPHISNVMKGIPVLLKDNIATKDKLNTTSGSYALFGSVVPRDAGVVDRLRRAGAIILGKAGLTEWANFRSYPQPDGTGKMPDGWSARGDTVQNPYVLGKDPGGSSTGSAVGVAANLVTVSLGTETLGSIISPCNCNCVVGIKPTLGLTSRSGVIPITSEQDTIGPIGRTVSDAVYLLDVIVGYDPRDEITREASQYIPSGGFKQFLKSDGLRGKRLGNLWNHFKFIYDPDPSSAVPGAFQQHINTMREKGAIIINDLEIPNFMEFLNVASNGTLVAMKHEFKRDLNAYLSNLLTSPIRSLAEAIAFNERDPREKLEVYNQSLFTDSQNTSLPSSEYTQAVEKLKKLKEKFVKLMTKYNLDAFVSPENFGAALLGRGGFPGIIVPAGFKADGVPFGILFGGLKGSDSKLIEIAYAFEQATLVRRPPTLPT